MDISIMIVFLVLAYISYLNFKEDEPKLKERKAAFKEFKNLPYSIRGLIRENKKIKAIKEYRALFGAGLKEADDVISWHLPRIT
jgi:ribosomal protein L7/L12